MEKEKERQQRNHRGYKLIPVSTVEGRLTRSMAEAVELEQWWQAKDEDESAIESIA